MQKQANITYSDRLLNWFGIDPADNPGPTRAVIHKNDYESVRRLVEAALEPGSDGIA